MTINTTNSIVGGWSLGDTAITFLPNNTYFLADVHTQKDNGVKSLVVEDFIF
jgi:hypothetical protein